jgi:hypothetical protein
MKRKPLPVLNMGTIYVQMRKWAGVEDGDGTDNIEARIREYLERTYAKITVGQVIPVMQSEKTYINLSTDIPQIMLIYGHSFSSYNSS